jgi:hypothetical protein
VRAIRDEAATPPHCCSNAVVASSCAVGVAAVSFFAAVTTTSVVTCCCHRRCIVASSSRLPPFCRAVVASPLAAGVAVASSSLLPPLQCSALLSPPPASSHAAVTAATSSRCHLRHTHRRMLCSSLQHPCSIVFCCCHRHSIVASSLATATCSAVVASSRAARVRVPWPAVAHVRFGWPTSRLSGGTILRGCARGLPPTRARAPVRNRTATKTFFYYHSTAVLARGYRSEICFSRFAAGWCLCARYGAHTGLQSAAPSEF